MRIKSIEEIHVSKIESAIRSLDHGTKRPHEINIGNNLRQLATINYFLYTDLSDKYSKILDKVERKKIADLYK